MSSAIVAIMAVDMPIGMAIAVDMAIAVTVGNAIAIAICGNVVSVGQLPITLP